MGKRFLIEDKIVEEFLRMNPELRIENLLWRLDGRLEWVCKHGVGHTVYEPKEGRYKYIHGCDNCCRNIKTYRNVEYLAELSKFLRTINGN